MRKLFLSLTIIYAISAQAQDVKIRPKFFTGELTRVAVSLGGEFGSLNPKGTNVAENIENGNPANLSVGIGLDVYSPKSILGLYTGMDINFKNYAVDIENSQARDSISTTYLEIPVYAKLRFGNQNSKTHFWLAGGAGYAFPLTAERETITEAGVILPLDENSDQAKGLPFIGGLAGIELIIPLGKNTKGEEVFNRDDFRILFYGGYKRDLGERLNQDAFSSGNSVYGNYEDPELSFSSFSFGIKLFYRFTQLGRALKDIGGVN